MKNTDTKTVTKTIVGIDYSLTSPALCINIDGDAGLMFYYLTNKKKYTGMIRMMTPI